MPRSLAHCALLMGLFTGLIATLIACGAHAENWPNWRGPTQDGSAPGGGYPTELDTRDGVAWRADLPGAGASTPILWGDHIFVTAGDDASNTLLCFARDGAERWRVTLGASRPGKHAKGTAANPSPVTDGKHVAAYFKSGDLACVDFAGKKLWAKNLQDEYAKDTLWWDLGTSPVLTTSGVVVAVMQEGDSFLVCLDLETGAEVWKTERVYERPRESDQAYTTPFVTTLSGRETVVTFGSDHLTGHDAKTGALLWDAPGFNPKDEGMWRAIASPTPAGGMAVVPFGRGDFLAGVQLGESGEGAVAWNEPGHGADVPSPAVHEGKAYVLSDRGALAAFDVATGERLWRENLPRGRGNYFASPVWAQGHLYCVREDGAFAVVKVSGEGMELVSQGELDEEVLATPALVDGRVYVRTRQHLICFK